MNKNNRIYIIITGLVAITLIWLSRPASDIDGMLNGRDQSLRLNEKQLQDGDVRNRDVEGVLWPSDDETKGNLMLVNNNATIYIRTSRDFNDLTGKYVIASVDGTLDNFTLLNIEENLAKDGFIKTN